MTDNLLDIVRALSLRGKKISGDLYTPNTETEYAACDCGCEQDGEGYCMDC